MRALEQRCWCAATQSVFTNDRGQDVSLFEIDYGGNYESDLKIKSCIEKFNQEHPGVADKVFFGDQSNTTFLAEIVSNTGGALDVIIDDGGHQTHLIMTSFEFLWPHLAPGGWYVIEDLTPGLYNVAKLIAGWAVELACGGGEGHPCNRKEARIDKYRSQTPVDMLQVRCSLEICAFQKAHINASTHAGRRRHR